MNSVDIAVGVVLLVSGVFALVRGFVHEVLAHAGWILSALAALWGVRRVPEVHNIAHQYIHNDLMADVAAGVAIFLVLLVILSFITHAISRRVQQSALGSTDRALGFVFGLVRGWIFCSLAYMVVVWLMPQPPDWFREAKSMPIVKRGAEIIQSLLPEQIAALEQSAKDAADKAQSTAEEVKQTQEMFDKLQSPEPKPDPNAANKGPGYDTKGMNRLIENANGGKQ